MMWWKRLKKPDEKKEKELRDKIEEEGGISGKDTFAMILSALLVLVPVSLGVLLLLYFLARLFFRI